MYMHAVYYVHECMYLIISYIQRCYVQDTILVIPPYPYCIEEENDDVQLKDCWYACQQLLFTCYLRPGKAANMVGRVPLIPLFLAGDSTPTIPHEYRQHKRSGFPVPVGTCDTAAADGRRGSNVFDVNPW